MTKADDSVGAAGRWGTTFRQGFLNLTESKAVQRVVALTMLTVLAAIVVVVLCLLPESALGKVRGVIDMVVEPVVSKTCTIATFAHLDGLCDEKS